MPTSYAAADLPACPVCLETLGKWGGPATLPCGHNGCKDCLSAIRTRKTPQCPLCRAPFDPSIEVAVNHELRDLVAFATMVFLDDTERAEGWEAFPDGRATAEFYSEEMRRRGEGQGPNYLHPSPSAPPAVLGPVADSATDREVLSMEPPQWLPDSYATHCGSCHLQFRPLTRLRHHCRMCGKIFCHSCCHKRMLLPPKYSIREPQRVCEMCSSLLQPLQPYLAGTHAHAAQQPVHDAVDSVSLRSWINSPWTHSLDEDIYKVSNILQTFTRARRLRPEAAIPAAVLHGARGLAIMSALKVGAGWSATLGTGVIVSRADDGSWSAPCAVACCGLGWGLQLGGELTDLLLVLRSEEAVRACCGMGQLGMAGNVGLALGPVGRHAESAVMLASTGTASTLYSYSCSKGAFIGLSLDSTLMYVRASVNENFYGYPVTASQLLLERSVPQPPAASTLYDALHCLTHKYDELRPEQRHAEPEQRQAQAQVHARQVHLSTVSSAPAAQAGSSTSVPGGDAAARSMALADEDLRRSMGEAAAAAVAASRTSSAAAAATAASTARPAPGTLFSSTPSRQGHEAGDYPAAWAPAAPPVPPSVPTGPAVPSSAPKLYPRVVDAEEEEESYYGALFD